MNDWQVARAKYVGKGGFKCSCCNKGLPKKHNGHTEKHTFNQLIRSNLKRMVKREMIEDLRD